MAINVNVKWDRSELAALENGPFKAAAKRALRKAGSTALRDMRSEASKRVRRRKAIRPRYVRRALTLQRPRGGGDIGDMAWAVNVDGEPVALTAFPHRQTKKGVSVQVNRGQRSLIEGAFVARMKSGHVGVFRRRGKERLPIQERFGSRPVDALLHKGEADGVAERGGRSFSETFRRVLPLEIGKSK